VKCGPQEFESQKYNLPKKVYFLLLCILFLSVEELETHNPKDESGSFLETSGTNHPTTRRNNPEDLTPAYRNKFETEKIF
jgi:hypothetical protein